MSNEYLDIFSEISSFFMEQLSILEPTLQISWPNAAFEAPSNETWIRFNTLPASANNIEIGSGDDPNGSYKRHSGIIIIQIFQPLNEGDARSLELAQIFDTIFRGKSAPSLVPPILQSHVGFIDPRLSVIGVSDGYYQTNVTIDYQT